MPAGAPLELLGSSAGSVLLLILGVWSFDTGRSSSEQVRRDKFLTHISPSKSIEGVVGGLVATTIVTALMLAGLRQQPLGAWCWPPLGLSAQGGDLAESMLSAARAPVSGTLIPGHGGILDRIDSCVRRPGGAVYVLALAR